MDRILKKIEKKEDFQSGECQSDGQIEDLEKKLKLHFPESYKYFLRNYGYVAFAGGEILGVSDDMCFDLVTTNQEAFLEELPSDFKKLPSNAVIIKNYAGGGYYLLYTKESIRCGEVALILSEAAYEEVNSWPSFEAFLEDYYCSEY